MIRRSAHGHRSLAGDTLHTVDHLADFLRALRRPLRQLAHFIGHHGKAPPAIAGPRRLNGGIQRQQIGLLGNACDHRDDCGHLASFGFHPIQAAGCEHNVGAHFLQHALRLTD